MKILVKGYFSLGKAMQDKSVVELETEAASIRDILNHLAESFGKDLTDLIFEPGTGELASHIHLFVNGRSYLSMPDKLDTQLKDGDEVALFPPLAGG
jgi:MoaD family protein